MSIPLPPSEPPPPAALWQSFERAAERRGPAPALDFGTTVVSFADLHALALRAAAFLNQHNVGSGDVVALQLPKPSTICFAS